MHRLLERQIKKTLGKLDGVPADWLRLIDAVDEAYRQSDEDRIMLERSMELSSRELLERNAKLTAAESKYRSIFENATEGIFQTTPDGRFISANPAMAEICGYANPDELIAAVTDIGTQLYVDRDRRDQIRAEIARHDRAFECELQIRRKDGGMAWISMTVRAVRDVHGTVTQYEGTSHDISAKRNAEHERHALQSKLLDLSRQGGMMEVATGVLHNVGNVLNSVNVSLALASKRLRELKLPGLKKAAELLIDHRDDPSFLTQNEKGRRVPEYLKSLADHLVDDQKKIVMEMDSLAENLEHIKRTVTAQQNYAKVSGLHETVNVAVLVEDAVRLNKSSLKLDDSDIIREFESLPAVTADKHQVMQILVNLLNNAAEAMAESGRECKLTIRLGPSQTSPMNFFVSVHDTGIGIPKENLTRIFNHGFTTKPNGHGFGLHGSAITANALGGSLSVDSEGIGAGATFTLELPMRPPTLQFRRAV